MDLNKCSSYQILAHLGYAECIQLILNFIEGIFGVAVNVFTHWLAKVSRHLVSFSYKLVFSLQKKVKKLFLNFCFCRRLNFFSDKKRLIFEVKSVYNFVDPSR